MGNGHDTTTSTGHRLALMLRTAYLTFHRRTNAEFARFDLTADQFVLLSALTHDSRITQIDLARRIASDPNTVSGMLMRLENRGLVIRQRSEVDGRAWCVSLTAQGRKLQSLAWDGTASSREMLGKLFSTTETSTLINCLERIALTFENAASQEDEPPQRKINAHR